MAISSSRLQLGLLFFLFLTPFSLSSDPSTLDLHDLLPIYGLPKGLIPENVKSYSLNPEDKSFTIELTHECYVQFSDLVWYDTVLTGKLGDGKVSDASGIKVKKLFAWFPITGIQVHQSSKSIEFQVGYLSEILPLSMFEDIPSCRKGGFQESLLASI